MLWLYAVIKIGLDIFYFFLCQTYLYFGKTQMQNIIVLLSQDVICPID